MSHDIAMINGRAAMAYLGKTPWHKLGTAMDGNPNVADALSAANLDWNVELKPMFIESGEKVPKRKAVVRDVDGAVLSTVGDKYHPIQNSEAFGILQPACEQFGVVIETAGALNNGEKVWMLARLPESIEVVEGDRVDGYFLVRSSHNGKSCMTARPTPIRVVCANTLSIATRDKKAGVIKLRHSSSAKDSLDDTAHLISSLVQHLKDTGETFRQLADRKMTQDEMDDYFIEVLGITEKSKQSAVRTFSEVAELGAGKATGFEFAPGTLWTAYNALTEYVDHRIPLEASSKKGLITAQKSALFGSNNKLKARALKIAQALV